MPKDCPSSRPHRLKRFPSDLPEIGGITPLSTLDYPGRLSAVLFCQGCPWRCAYCHNAHLQSLHGPQAIPWARLLEFLQERRGFLEAVVFSGGEPTLHRNLLPAIRLVRSLGFSVGLHTAGIFPGRLAELLPHLDWVGLDVKAPYDQRYDRITQRAGSARRAKQALELILNSKIPHELRTTRHPALLSARDCEDIQAQLAARGAQPTKWQEFRTEGCKNERLTTS